MAMGFGTRSLTFKDAEEMIEIDAGDETYWLDGNQVIYMWIHRVKA